MAKCKMCGKSGLFLKLDSSGKCKECASKKVAIDAVSTNLAKMEKEQKIADKQIEQINKAREKYEAVKDYESMIKVYEKVFSENNPWNTCSHKIKLSELYLKVGRNNDSWRLLNTLLTDFPNEIARIRKLQYKQLKTEKKFDEALKMWFIFKFDDFKNYHSWKQSDLESFTKEALTLGKKLKITTEDIEMLAKILESCVVDKKSSEATASKKYVDWFKKLNIG